MATRDNPRRRKSGGEAPRSSSWLGRLVKGLVIWTLAVALLGAMGLTAAVLVTRVRCRAMNG